MVQRKTLLKKVLYISYDGMTDPLGQSQVIPYLQGLRKAGYEITLLSFEKRDRFQKSSDLIRSILTDAGINWVPLFFSKRPPVLSKLYDNWRLKRTVKQLHAKHNFSFTHCRSYVPASGGLALLKSKGVPFLFDMRGFWVDERVDNGQWDLKKPLFKWAYKSYKKKEKEYLSRAAHIISLTHNGKQELVASYQVPAEKISVIPCCVDLSHFDFQKTDPSAVEKLKADLQISNGSKVLTYLGTLGGWYMTGEMLDFFKKLKAKQPGSKFLFVTHDAEKDVLQAAASKDIPASDIIVRPAKRQEVPLFLAISNWSIFFIKDAYSKKASSPTKQGEIMAMGIPLICNDIGDTGHIIHDTNAGIVVNKFTEIDYEKAVAQIPNLEKLTKTHLREGAFKYFNLETGIETYKEIYHKLAE